MIGFQNGVYKSVDCLALPITAITINRSYAAFEFFTLINEKPFYLERHLDRLFNTLKLLRIEIEYDKNQISLIIHNLLEKNQSNELSYKLFVIPEPDFSYKTFKGELYIFPVKNLSRASTFYKTGAKLLLKKYSRFLPEAKTTNYTPFIYWENEVISQKAIDVLYYDKKIIRETSRSNIFIIKNHVIYTPKKDVLKGITRSICIDLIKINHFEFKEKNICLNEIFTADEVFITSTTREITPITQIENSVINHGVIGNITQQLMLDFKTLKLGY